MPSACSLFSGIGGIDLGFIQAGFDIPFTFRISTDKILFIIFLTLSTEH
jgi:site-specific DNA-cytosine methylase